MQALRIEIGYQIAVSCPGFLATRSESVNDSIDIAERAMSVVTASSRKQSHGITLNRMAKNNSCWIMLNCCQSLISMYSKSQNLESPASGSTLNLGDSSPLSYTELIMHVNAQIVSQAFPFRLLSEERATVVYKRHQQGRPARCMLSKLHQKSPNSLLRKQMA